MLTRQWAILRGKENKLVKDLKETTLSFKKLGKKYGVTRQGVHIFCKRQGIKRPEKPKRHQTEQCPLCQKLLQISKRPHSEFISTHTIVKEIGGPWGKYPRHLRTLRSKGLVSPKFGRLHSKRIEKAYAIYFTKRLPICKIGREVGLKNFPSIIRQYRALGWNIPPSLYGRRGRNRVKSKIQEGKKR